VKLLCAQALAAQDEGEVQGILAQLRSLVHRRFEELRRDLSSACSPLLTGVGERDRSKEYEYKIGLDRESMIDEHMIDEHKPSGTSPSDTIPEGHFR
jgi:hypothetical protein